MTSKITVITGDRHAGKTLACQRIIDEAKQQGLSAGGLITPGRYDAAGTRTGFYVQMLPGGDKRLLGSAIEGELQGTRLGMWIFDDSALQWGNNELGSTPIVDVLVIDEIGPLELERDAGWTNAIPLLRKGQFDQAYVVIRPECVKMFRDLGFIFELCEIKAD
ncbi:MAG TPA: nucleoside-triphosphatase [Bellilinea sp.]|nr:nucleoside-triphosphatase [Bellilinea sp.]